MSGMRDFNLRVVALTRGAEGSLLFQAGRWSEQPAGQVEVQDTWGQGMPLPRRFVSDCFADAIST
jgi:hypothetical protein